MASSAAASSRGADGSEHSVNRLGRYGYRSKANEEFLLDHGKISRIHRKKPKGKPMNKATARANAVKSKIRARVEPVFAEQKDRMGLFIRTIGKARAQATITLASIACTMKRWRWLEKRSAA